MCFPLQLSIMQMKSTFLKGLFIFYFLMLIDKTLSLKKTELKNCHIEKNLSKILIVIFLWNKGVLSHNNRPT